jgi:hypothetical protein
MCHRGSSIAYNFASDTAPIYSVAWPPASHLNVSTANDGWARLNGVALTVVANKAAMTGGTCATEGGKLYIWGSHSENLTVDVLTDHAFAVNTASSTTVFTGTAALPQQSDGYYIGRLVDFDPSLTAGATGANSNSQRMVSAYTAASRTITVSPGFPETPVAGNTCTMRFNFVDAADWRPYTLEITQANLTDPANTTKTRRITHTFDWCNAYNMAFDQHGVVNSSRDGQIISWHSQYNGGTRRDCFLALVDPYLPASATRNTTTTVGTTTTLAKTSTIGWDP